MAADSIKISALRDPVLRALAQTWNKNGDDWLDRSELPNAGADLVSIFERMAANPGPQRLGPAATPPTSPSVALSPRSLAGAFEAYRGVTKVLPPGDAASFDAAQRVVDGLAAVDSCSSVGAIIGASVGSYALGPQIGVPVGVMAGGTVGAQLDNSGACSPRVFTMTMDEYLERGLLPKVARTIAKNI